MPAPAVAVTMALVARMQGAVPVTPGGPAYDDCPAVLAMGAPTDLAT